MNGDRLIPASPTFFRLIGRALAVTVMVVAVAAFLIPAPLEMEADPVTVPNPAKAGWFLLWVQELVSWSTMTLYPLLGVVALIVFLPWLTRQTPPDRARWFPRWNRVHQWFVVLCGVAVVTLTVVALLFRGDNWRLVMPWGG